MDSFQTIAAASEGFFKDRGSKFYAFAYPVQTEAEISQIQKQLRKKFYDARHHVYAFRLGAKKDIFRASDDGEPANSSGPPILGQIRSHELSDILIVVIRYFGGTKLGIPGLINAYRTAAEDAIDHAKIIKKMVNDTVHLKFEYPLMNRVMRVIKEEKLEQITTKFELACEISLHIRQSQTKRILEKFNQIYGLSVSV